MLLRATHGVFGKKQSRRQSPRKITALAGNSCSLPAVPIDPFTRRVRVTLFER